MSIGRRFLIISITTISLLIFSGCDFGGGGASTAESSLEQEDVIDTGTQEITSRDDSTETDEGGGVSGTGTDTDTNTDTATTQQSDNGDNSTETDEGGGVSGTGTVTATTQQGDNTETDENGGVSDTGTGTTQQNNDNNNENSGGDLEDGDSDSCGDLQKSGLLFYPESLKESDYRLEQLNDKEFNGFSEDKKLKIATNLLNTLFFDYPLQELKDKIESGNFLSNIRDGFNSNLQDPIAIEEYILDENNFKQFKEDYSWTYPQTLQILRRFYVMNKIDKYYFNNWMTYILTQTIMFSPAYELNSVHSSNVEIVYNVMLGMLKNGYGVRYLTYLHMMSESNWRRFRSPEDNGREMLEIFLHNTNDSLVPSAGQALQNWRINSDGDTLVVGLNDNTEPINLFSTTIYNGEDYYRELVKYKEFIPGVTKRLVDYFFADKDSNKKQEIVDRIVSSNPERWEDIFKQIIFSKEYLLHNRRVLNAEELVYSLIRKTFFRAGKETFRILNDNLISMKQAPMRYKLGKPSKVPIDSLSVAYYAKYVRLYILKNYGEEAETDKESGYYEGWLERFVDDDKFKVVSDDPIKSLRNFIDYLFEVTVLRKSRDEEFTLLKNFMYDSSSGNLRDNFNLLKADYRERYIRKRNISTIVFHYITKLEEFYMFKEVE